MAHRIIGAVRHAPSLERSARTLLVGPYDPKGGEYTFLAPPLGVWRLAGALTAAGVTAEVFDPNCCAKSPESALREVLSQHWDVIGFSMTGMTLQYDVVLAHLARQLQPHAILVAGGMEPTFDPDTVLRVAPCDLAVLGEGERPLLEIARRLQSGETLEGLTGVAWRDADGRIERRPQAALDRESLREAIFATPYERMPYASYWERLERRYAVGQLPVKAEREARLAEIRSVRLITLNYCPMGCTFCSSTNFLHAAQGGETARIARLDEHECVAMIERIVHTHPNVRTVIFQDDIFVFTKDARILPLCQAIVDAKTRGRLPASLQFISTNRIDAMTPERLAAMKAAGFRVLGFGVESFAPGILKEFNKAQIEPFIVPMLTTALQLGITPFLDMILSSPRCQLQDVAKSVVEAYRWIEAGCEVGIYPYVIPFSGSAMSRDATLKAHTVYERRCVQGTSMEWDQPAKILPIDPQVRDAILAIEAAFEKRIAAFGENEIHLPSRTRSLIWVASAAPVLSSLGCDMTSVEKVETRLNLRLGRAAPVTRPTARTSRRAAFVPDSAPPAR
jgi:radical SAM superfamily enzyme YgiQ (UPF0313 family)